MHAAQLLGGFDDLGDGFCAGKKSKKEAICWLGWRDLAEEVNQRS
jgi:hypothetical protein